MGSHSLSGRLVECSLAHTGIRIPDRPARRLFLEKTDVRPPTQ